MIIRHIVTSIAALFLATGAAHARCCEWSKCGKVFVEDQVVKHGPRPSTSNVLVENPPRNFTYRCNGKGECWLNGKLCRTITDKEYYEAHRDDYNDEFLEREFGIKPKDKK
jgi:hypothetical protein